MNITRTINKKDLHVNPLIQYKVPLAFVHHSLTMDLVGVQALESRLVAGDGHVEVDSDHVDLGQPHVT